jgi:hypothetical protein
VPCARKATERQPSAELKVTPEHFYAGWLEFAKKYR